MLFKAGQESARVYFNEAARQGLFKDNSEVQEMGLRSVLCLPVLKQSNSQFQNSKRADRRCL